MQQQSPEKKLSRVISKLGFGAININNVIGAGIFGLPAVAAAATGAFSPWLFVISGGLIFTVVLSFARAASMFRETGGAIVYASHAFGPFIGFQTGWMAYVSRVAAMGANANLLVTYASWFWSPLGDSPWRAVALTGLFSALTWLNIAGVKNSMNVVYGFTVLKLLPLSLLLLFGLGHIDVDMLGAADMPELSSLGEAVLIVLYAYVGFEGTVITAGEGRNPRRDLPGALIKTILLIGAIYVLVQAVAVSILPTLANSKTALADVAAMIFGPVGATVLTLGAVFSIGGNISASVLSAPRMTFALARDGAIPAWFARVHPRYHTPYASIMAYGIICLFMALSGSFIWLAVISTLVRLLTYMLCIAALPILERRADTPEDAFRIPGGMLIPATAMLLCAWLVTQASQSAWLSMLGFFIAGSLLYWNSRRKA